MNRLKAVMLDLIANEAPLGPERRDHALKGAWASHRECHIGGDFLLIHQIDDSPKPSGSINFVRAGTHAELFEGPRSRGVAAGQMFAEGAGGPPAEADGAL